MLTAKTFFREFADYYTLYINNVYISIFAINIT